MSRALAQYSSGYVDQFQPRSRPGDAEIRAELRAYLAIRHADEPETVVLEELGLRRRYARADLAVVNDILHGYEIKSDRDSLRRLDRQIPVYCDVFDRVTMVVGPRHVAMVERTIPAWWEVLEVSPVHSGLRISCRRAGATNPGRSARTLVELLWHDDALALLDASGGARGFRSKPRREVWDRICEVCSEEQTAAAVRNALRARRGRGSAPKFA